MLLIFDPGHYPLRSFVLVVAISSSIALLVVMSSLSVGVRESSRDALENVGADIYVVPDSLNPLLLDLQRFDHGWAVIREIEGSPYPPDHLSPRLKDTIFFGIDGERIGETIIHGLIPGNESYFHQFSIVEGSWFKVENDPVREKYLAGLGVDSSTFTSEVLISEEFSRDHRMGPGDMLSLSSRMSSSEKMLFNVRGIYVDTLSQRSVSVLIHLGELHYIQGLLGSDPLTEILAAYPEGTDLEEVVEWSNSTQFPFDDIVDLYTREEFLSELYKFTDVLSGFSAIVISVTLFVSLIFTATIFMISTKERTVEISILRAIGFRPTKVFLMVMRDSILLYLTGALAGFILGMLMNRLLNVLLRGLFDGLPTTFQPFRLDLSIILWTLLSAFLLSLISGLLPALVSARSRPVNALRREL
ncbi:MAG: ABC transporter permease [Candidatus Thermoplasmatota archaeon]|nr:ABC transporter permease [Candidatus Thermoplasmatota archaeon]